MQAAIAVLPPELIDQIAAGEVIERPASVVKELIDNAIDAGARSIAVETHAGGRELIKVVDDGVGMTPNDAVLAFERHATSKLRVFDDLWGLTTMGFRGEALPAIASVSRLTLTTRRAEAVAATRVVIDSGRLESVDEVGAPVGTTVEVVGLLRNVPARLKFLKSDPTEASHTTDLVVKIAMAYPALHLRLRHNGRNTLDVPPDRDVFARAQALLGRRTGTRLVTSLGEDAGVRVTCVLGAPELAQTTARGVQLFVRRRPVRDRGLLHAVCVGYGELVPRGRYPLAVLLVDPPATAVDVNVHPQKAEVRFADPGAVCAAVRHVVQAAVARAQWEVAPSRLPVALSGTPPPPLPFDAPASAAATRFAAELREVRNPWNHDRAQADLGLESPGRAGMRSTPDEGVRRWNESPGRAGMRSTPDEGVRRWNESPGRAGMRSTPDEGVRRWNEGGVARSWAREIKQRVLQVRAAESADTSHWAGRPHSDPAGVALPTQSKAKAPLPEALDNPTYAGQGGREPFADRAGNWANPGSYSSLGYVGQLDLTYLLYQGDRGLVIMDQHVAFEWVELDCLARGADAATGELCPVRAQQLLIPIGVDLRPDLAMLASNNADLLAKIGFQVEPTDARTLVVRGVPAGFSSRQPGPGEDRMDPIRLLRDVLERWATASTAEDRLTDAWAELACRRSVPAGQVVTRHEAERLLHALDRVACPARLLHRRPLLIQYSLAEIGRRFNAL